MSSAINPKCSAPVPAPQAAASAGPVTLSLLPVFDSRTNAVKDLILKTLRDKGWIKGGFRVLNGIPDDTKFVVPGQKDISVQVKYVPRANSKSRLGLNEPFYVIRFCGANNIAIEIRNNLTLELPKS